jgi:CheY-like chemotaxis protein
MLEHDDDDRYITQTVFDEQGLDVNVKFVTSPEEFFQYLNECAASEETFPSLILLNYYSKPSTGVEILKDLKSDKRFQHIPVIILGAIVQKEIVRECYINGATSFIEKPMKATDTDDKIRNFFRYWFETVSLP